MKLVKLVDGVTGNHYTSPRYPTDVMQWQRVSIDQDFPHETVVYTNLSILDSIEYTVGTRVAWLGESRAIHPWVYEFVEDNITEFDHVLTYDDSLVAAFPERVSYVPRGECWIDADAIGVHKKSRFISFISSGKEFPRFAATGHGLRQDLYTILTRKKGSLGRQIERAGVLGEIDIYGEIAGNPIPTKNASLQDYRFQIAVENMIHDAYFTEKIIDCFAMGTIPIYRGTHRVNDFFNPHGILLFDTLEQLTEILLDLKESDYDDRFEAVKENFEIAKSFFSREELLCRYGKLLEL